MSTTHLDMSNHQVGMTMSLIPDKVKDFLKTFTCCIAGGFVRDAVEGRVPNDIDIYFVTENEARRAARQMSEMMKSGVIFVSKNSVTINPSECPYELSFITCKGILSTDPQDVWNLIRQFDFTCCQFAVWWNGSEWQGISGVNSQFDNHNMILMYTGDIAMGRGVGSLIRAFKFVRKGWGIPVDQQLAIAARIQKLETFPYAETGDSRTTNGDAVINALMMLTGTKPA